METVDNGRMEVVHNGKVFGILLADLSKAFDCLSHELMFAKLPAYGFSVSALRLIYSYLANRKSIRVIVPGKKSFLAFLKDQC